MIKNIIFDLGNIIIKCDRDRIIDYYAKNKEEKEYLKNEIFNSIEWKSMDYGDTDIKESMEIINKRNEYKYEKLTKDFFSDWYKRYDINEDVVNIAKKLKEKGYSIFVISNFGKESYEYYKNTCDFLNFQQV